MRKLFEFVILFSLAGFCQKAVDLPRYQPVTRIDDDVVEFLNNQDSLQNKIMNKVAQTRAARDILGRISRDTMIYVLREELFEKKISVGVIDLTLRNKQGKKAIEFQKDQNGNKFVRLNGKEISLDDYHKLLGSNIEQKWSKTPYVRYETLTAREIKKLLLDSKPVHIFLKKNVPVKNDDVYYEFPMIFELSGVDDMHSVGAKGSGVGLFYQEACPDVGAINQNYFMQSGSCLSPEPHATKVARLLQLTAPEAMVVNFIGSMAVIPTVDDSANYFNPKLEIGSYSWHYGGVPCINGSYCYHDQELDEHIYEDRLIYFVAAGNMDDSTDVYVGSPGNALNAITVGAVSPHTGAYNGNSKWRNSEILNQKPEIANYTNFDLVFSYGWIDGTSASTAYSAGIAANMLSADSDLKRHPEVIKALFLINATTPISGGTHDFDDLHSIASKLPYFDINEGYRYRWWSGSNANFFDNNEKIIFTETGISSGQHCRAAISWLTSGSYVGEYGALAQDIDLFVYHQGSTTLLKSSESPRNPFEVVDFVTQSNSNLRFEIVRYSNSYSDDVVLGFTMRCDSD